MHVQMAKVRRYMVCAIEFSRKWGEDAGDKQVASIQIVEEFIGLLKDFSLLPSNSEKPLKWYNWLEENMIKLGLSERCYWVPC